MKYRKKPVIVDAIQFKDVSAKSIREIQDFKNGDVKVTYTGEGQPQIEIFTLEGTMKANIGDYIIKGVKGECYPCKPDIFEMSYEVVGLNEVPTNKEAFPTNKERFMADFEATKAKTQGRLSYIVVAVKLPTKTKELITNTQGLEEKYQYYLEAYDEDMRLKSMPKIQIVGWMFI